MRCRLGSGMAVASLQPSGELFILHLFHSRRYSPAWCSAGRSTTRLCVAAGRKLPGWLLLSTAARCTSGRGRCPDAALPLGCRGRIVPGIAP